MEKTDSDHHIPLCPSVIITYLSAESEGVKSTRCDLSHFTFTWYLSHCLGTRLTASFESIASITVILITIIFVPACSVVQRLNLEKKRKKELIMKTESANWKSSVRYQRNFFYEGLLLGVIDINDVLLGKKNHLIPC